MQYVTPELAQVLADRYPEVSADYWNKIDLARAPQDQMYEGDEPEYWSMAHYLGTGMEATRLVKNSLALINRTPDDVKDILDFPCGYGRVLRHLKVGFPNSNIVGSEIFQSCLDFCSQQFDIDTFLSDKNFQITSERKFDVIWCGSLFTHITSKRFDQLINFFESQLKENGIMIFTLHGRFTRHHIDTIRYQLSRPRILQMKIGYETTGYGYTNYHDSDSYGLAFIKLSWLAKYFDKKPSLQIVGHYERGWDTIQDVMVIQKKNVYDTNR
jgi:SAM-dependent methyltransferase